MFRSVPIGSNHEIRMKRIISLEKENLEARKKYDEIQQKYSNKCRKLGKIQSRYSVLKSKENKRQRNENSAGLDVRTKHLHVFERFPFLLD